MIEWNTPEGLIVDSYEKEELKDVFINVSPENVNVNIVSGLLPNGITLNKVRDGRYELKGVLPLVEEKTDFNFTLRGVLDDEISDRNFIIRINNEIVDWNDKQSTMFEVSETHYSTIQLELVNANGNEEFFKISGELPNGMTINKSGLIYGVVGNIDKEKVYEFRIGVKCDDKIILEKTFSIKVIKLSSLQNPVWITEEGLIGTINYNEVSELLVKAYDPNNLPLSYELDKKSQLPQGLELSKQTGRITGKLKTEYSRNWEFTVIASNGSFQVSRTFHIATNIVLSEFDITWETDPIIGDFKIGESVFVKMKTNSNYPVSYTLITDNLPKGLSINNKGEIAGMIDYQDLGTYNFIIEANNGYKIIERTFTINVIKGLGLNSVKCFFYINHENDKEYASLLSKFDRKYSYESLNPMYNIPVTPEIDICTLTCFDKTLIKHMLNFNESLTMNIGQTKHKDYIKDGKISYTTYYKELKESPSNGGYKQIEGNKVYIEVSKESPTGYINKNTKEPVTPEGEIKTDYRQGKKYIIYEDNKIYVDILNSSQYYEIDSKLIVKQNEPIYTEEVKEKDEYVIKEYIVKDNKKVYIAHCIDGMLKDITTQKCMRVFESEYEIFVDRDEVLYFYKEGSKVEINYPSTNEIRNILSTPIYVDKINQENVMYDLSTQEVIPNDGTKYLNYTIKWDDKHKTYYAEYEGETVYLDVYAIEQMDEETKQPVYASWERPNFISEIFGGEAPTKDWDGEIFGGEAPTYTFDDVIDANAEKFVLKPLKVYAEYLNTPVDFKQYLVFEKDTQNLQENILFTLDWNNKNKFIIINGKMHHIGFIDNPWVYLPEQNENLGFPTKIVLPYVNDENVIVESDKKVISFLDKKTDFVPLWKTRDIDEWKPQTFYRIGDVITYEGKYYICITKNFISENTFSNTYLRELSDKEMQEYLKPKYFPSLNIFYSKPGTNLIASKEVNQEEYKGKYWTNRKWIFYEVHFQAKYNLNIDNFSIDFYNHNNESNPEFQLI